MNEEHVFYKEVNFNFIDWQSKFDAKKFEFKSTSKWIEIHNVPVELMHSKILIEIGDKLGKFIAIEANWSEKSDIKILIEVDNGMKNLNNITLDIVDGNYILSLVWYHGPISENLSFCKRTNPSIQKPKAPKLDKHKEMFDKVDIQFNNYMGGFIINIDPQELYNHATPPPPLDLRAGNNPDKIKHHNESLECRHEDQIKRELNNVIDNLMGKLVEEFIEEVYNDALADVANNNISLNLDYEWTPPRPHTLGNNSTKVAHDEIILDSPNMEDSSPVVEGLNENEEREFIIKKLINMQEVENNMVLNNNQSNSCNRGILRMVGDKLTPDCAKSTTKKRGRKSSFRQDENGWGSRGADQNHNFVGSEKVPPTPRKGINILTWNVRALGTPNKLCLIKRNILKSAMDLVMLQETKLGKIDMTNFSRKFTQWQVKMVDSIGALGGLEIMWKKNSITFTFYAKMQNWMVGKVRFLSLNFEFIILNVYGPIPTDKKILVWQEIEQFLIN